MTRAPVFQLLPATALRAHEEVDDADVARLAEEIRGLGVVREPIWVSTDGVILNGHHRVAALRKLGVDRIPVWRVDYSDPAMELSRWGDGPAIEKAEVLRRAREGPLFPPKTSRHTWHGPPPAPRPTPLDELQIDGGRPSDRRSREPPEGSR
jgi:hypothetical protein